MEQEFASSLLESAVSEFSKLPGIGRKTALRLVLHLLRQDEQVAVNFGESIVRLRKEIRYCRVCHNISEHDVCPICANPARDASIICVVENVKDVNREYASASWCVSCAWRTYLAHGRHRAAGHRD